MGKVKIAQAVPKKRNNSITNSKTILKSSTNRNVKSVTDGSRKKIIADIERNNSYGLQSQENPRVCFKPVANKYLTLDGKVLIDCSTLEDNELRFGKSKYTFSPSQIKELSLNFIRHPNPPFGALAAQISNSKSFSKGEAKKINKWFMDQRRAFNIEKTPGWATDSDKDAIYQSQTNEDGQMRLFMAISHDKRKNSEISATKDVTNNTDGRISVQKRTVDCETYCGNQAKRNIKSCSTSVIPSSDIKPECVDVNFLQQRQDLLKCHDPVNTQSKLLKKCITPSNLQQTKNIAKTVEKKNSLCDEEKEHSQVTSPKYEVNKPTNPITNETPPVIKIHAPPLVRQPTQRKAPVNRRRRIGRTPAEPTAEQMIDLNALMEKRKEWKAKKEQQSKNPGNENKENV